MASSIELITEILADDSASFWLKSGLEWALKRDPVDAANDADLLAKVLADRADEICKPQQTLGLADIRKT